MWNVPSRNRLNKIPKLYDTESIPLKEKVIHLHFFIGGSDWYVVEYDGEDTFWGYVILGGDLLNAEWGYFSFSELKAINLNGLEINCELSEFWQLKPVSEIPKIRVF